MSPERVIAIFDNNEQVEIPADRTLYTIDHDQRVFAVGNVVRKPAHSLPLHRHVFLVLGGQMNRDRLVDDRATKIYLYPHRGLAETLQLLDSHVELEKHYFPLRDIIFDDSN